MAISHQFELLGAPLRNTRWSWGAQDSQGRIVMRVWDDEIISRNGARFVWLIKRGAYENRTRNHGFNERCRHVAAVRQGAPGYALMLTAVDKLTRPREIRAYDDAGVWKLGSIIEVDGDEYGELERFVATAALRSD